VSEWLVLLQNATFKKIKISGTKYIAKRKMPDRRAFSNYFLNDFGLD